MHDVSTTDLHNRFSGLDILRFCAALLIVLYHYTFHGPGAFDLTWVALPAPATFTRYFYMGVPLFFVISGFVIAYSANGRTVVEFARSRFSRIYPTFIVCMTATFVIAALFGGPKFGATFGQWLANWFVAAPLLKQPYVDSAYWSIVYEITFYGLIAILIWLRLFETRLTELVGVWLLVSICNELFLGSELLRRILITNYSGFFAAGISIFLVVKGGRSARAGALFALSVVVGALQADLDANWLREGGVELSHAIVVLLAIASPLAVVAAVAADRLPLSANLSLAVGGLTYPLYLLHQTIGYIVFNHLRWYDRPAALVLMTTIAMTLLSWLFYELADKPMHSAVNKSLKKLLTRRMGRRLRRSAVAAE